MSNPDEQRGAPDEQRGPADEHVQASSADPTTTDPAALSATADRPTSAEAETHSAPASAEPGPAPSTYPEGYPFVQGGYPPPPGSAAPGYASGYYPGYPYPTADPAQGPAGPAGYPPAQPPAAQPPHAAQPYPQPYPQGPYAQQPYPQQPYLQQPYAQQPYAPQPSSQQPYPPQGYPAGGYPPGHPSAGAAAGYGPGTYGGPPASTHAHPAPGAPTATRASAFHGVPARDYVTDALALVLLLVALGLGWDFRYAASERIEVVLVTIVSILSLSLFYLARSGALPRGWTNRTVLGARALANAPFALLVLVYLVLDMSVAFSEGPATGSVPGGVGPAVAIGLAGAALAASPRSAELRSARTVELVTLWTRRALAALLGTAVVVQFVGLVTLLVDASRYVRTAAAGAGIGALVVSALLVTAVAAGPLIGVLRGHGPWRRVLVAVAATAAATFVLYAPLNHEQADSGFHSATSAALGNAGYVILPTAGVLVLSPIWRRLVRPDASAEQGWFAAASRAWLSIALVAGAIALVQLIVLVTLATQRNGVDGWRVQLMLVVAACGVAALIARALFDATQPTRATALALTLVVVALGIVAVVLAAQQRSYGWTTTVDLPLLLVAFGLPALVAIALLGPAPVRAWFAAHGGGPRPAWDDTEPEPPLPTPGHPAAAAQQHKDLGNVGVQSPSSAGAVPVVVATAGGAAESADDGAAARADDGPAVRVDDRADDRADDEDEGVDETTHPRAVPAEAVAPEQPEAHVVPEEHLPGDDSSDDEGTTWFDEYSSLDSEPVPEQPHAPDQMAPGQRALDQTVAIAVPEDLGSGSVAATEAAPAPHGGDAPVPPHPYTAEQALDPSTELEVLAAIAAQAPELRVHLASNPSTYPDLLDWLGRLGDPQIDAALARRPR